MVYFASADKVYSINQGDTGSLQFLILTLNCVDIINN